jgi:hypothetical protein
LSGRTSNILRRVTLIWKHGEIGIHPVIEIMNNYLSSCRSKLMQNSPIITNLRYIHNDHEGVPLLLPCQIRREKLQHIPQGPRDRGQDPAPTELHRPIPDWSKPHRPPTARRFPTWTRCDPPRTQSTTPSNPSGHDTQVDTIRQFPYYKCVIHEPLRSIGRHPMQSSLSLSLAIHACHHNEYIIRLDVWLLLCGRHEPV